MFWKVMIGTSIFGLILTGVMLHLLYRKVEDHPMQWEIEVVKWQNEATVIEPGWEPFGFDKATNGIFVKRIKREEE